MQQSVSALTFVNMFFISDCSPLVIELIRYGQLRREDNKNCYETVVKLSHFTSVV